ncbi:hypothetical protein ACP4OV_002716 [Aristida adscensionis]
MGRPSGGRKPNPFLSPASSFSKRSRLSGRIPSCPRPPVPPPPPPAAVRSSKKSPARLWMRLDRRGGCEVFMCDKAFVAERTGVHTRDLRVIGPLLSRYPSITAREKAMVINLEFIRAIVTADEILLLEPLAHEVLPFVDKLRKQFPLKSLEVDVGASHVDNQDGKHAKISSAECDLPFELLVLELALESVCLSFNASIADLNRHAVSVLDELTKNVSTRNLERLRSLKSKLTGLLAGVHKVRDELEHLLDNVENLAQLQLTRKQTKCQQDEALLWNINFPSETSFTVKHDRAAATSVPLENDEGNLEILVEAYFMQLDGIRNKILLVRGYIVDTEDYINIQLDNKRNELIQLQLTLIIASFGITINTFIAAAFAMNIPNYGDNTAVGSFWPFVGGTSSFCLLLTVILLGYAWRNGLIGS